MTNHAFGMGRAAGLWPRRHCSFPSLRPPMSRREGWPVGQSRARRPPATSASTWADARNSRAVFVERNVISRTFLGVFVRGGGSGGNRIAENTLVGGESGQLGICYNPDGSGSADGAGRGPESARALLTAIVRRTLEAAAGAAR